MTIAIKCIFHVHLYTNMSNTLFEFSIWIETEKISFSFSFSFHNLQIVFFSYFFSFFIFVHICHSSSSLNNFILYYYYIALFHLMLFYFMLAGYILPSQRIIWTKFALYLIYGNFAPTTIFPIISATTKDDDNRPCRINNKQLKIKFIFLNKSVNCLDLTQFSTSFIDSHLLLLSF